MLHVANRFATLNDLFESRQAINEFVNNPATDNAGVLVDQVSRVFAKLDRDENVAANVEKIAAVLVAMGSHGERLLDWAQGHLHANSWEVVETAYYNIVAPRLEDVIA